MLNRNLWKRTQVLAPILVLLLLLTTTAALAATKLIIAKKGGIVDIAEGVCLKILPDALKEDTVISADMVRTKKRVCFYFGPSGTTFADNKPARLYASWKVIDDVNDFVLYGENGERIKPKIMGHGVEWSISHFSLYYLRRR